MFTANPNNPTGKWILVLTGFGLLCGVWQGLRHPRETGSTPGPDEDLEVLGQCQNPIAATAIPRGGQVAGDRAAPSWAIVPGREFWRPIPPSGQGIPGMPGLPAKAGALPFSADAVVDRVSHAFRPEASRDARQVQGDAYQVAINGTGVRFRPASSFDSPRAPDRSLDALAGVQPEFQVGFRTREISRGAERMTAPGPDWFEWHFWGNTAQRLLEDDLGLVEHCEARRAGIELTWILPRPPVGTGDLEIEMEIDGSHGSLATATGVHLLDEQGISRIKIGAVTVVSANGKRWAGSLAAEDGRLRITVPNSILTKAVYPLAIDPVISPEFGVDQPVEGPSPCTRAAPSVAAASTGFLVVWTHGKGETTEPAIFGARIDGSGALLDPDGFLVGVPAAEQTVCAVAALSNLFLVAWSGPRGVSATEWDIYGARVSGDGVVVDVPPLMLCNASGVQSTPAAAANGTDFLVAWRDNRSTGIYGALVNPDGRASPTNGLPICTAAQEQLMPAVASFGGDYLVVWQDYRRANLNQYYSDIYGARVSGDGRLLDATGIAICTRTNSQFYPAVAADDLGYLVVWEDYDVGGNDVWGAHVSSEGGVVETNGFLVSHAPCLQGNPSVAGGPDGFLVVWQDHRGNTAADLAADVYAGRLLNDGTRADGEGVAITTAGGGQYSPAVARHRDGYWIAWQDTRLNPGTALADVWGTHIPAGPAIAPTAEMLISARVNGEITPAVASTGANYLVVWSDNRNSGSTGLDIFGARVAADGSLLDPTAMALCTATNRQAEPAVAAQGSTYLVVWSDWRHNPIASGAADIYAVLVGADGRIITPEGLPMCTATNDQRLPAVVGRQDDFFVAWQDARNSMSTSVRWDIFGTRVAMNATLYHRDGYPVSISTGNQLAPAIAALGTQALVVWTDSRNGSATDVYGARVDSEGQVMETNGLAVAIAPGSQYEPAIAGSGAEYLVVWTDSRNSASNNLDIYGAWVSAEGVSPAPEGIPIRAVPGWQSAPATWFAGDDCYLVVWQETSGSVSNAFDVAGAILDRYQAAPRDLVQFHAGPDNQLAPAIASARSRHGLLVSQSRGLRQAGPRAVASRIQFIAPARLRPPLRLPDGRFQLELVGESGQRWRIEASANLIDWRTLETVVYTNGTFGYTDPESIGLSQRFYRLQLLP